MKRNYRKEKLSAFLHQNIRTSKPKHKHFIIKVLNITFFARREIR